MDQKALSVFDDFLYLFLWLKPFKGYLLCTTFSLAITLVLFASVPRALGEEAEETEANTEANNLKATSESKKEKLKQQRIRYRAALDALRLGDSRTFRRIKDELQSYPLYPYLEYEFLKRQPYRSVREPINEFLKNYSDSPVARSLRISLLKKFGRQQRWTEFRNYYDESINNTKLKCQFQEALYHTGLKKEAITTGLTLWNVNKSQPPECDPLFKLLTDKKAITEELAWHRYTKAVLAHRYELAGYLQSFLKTPRYASLARRYISLDRNFRLLGNHDLFPERSPEVSAVIAHALRHQAKNHPQQALSNWTYYLGQHPFDVATRAEVYTTIVRELYNDGNAVAVAQLINQQTELLDVNFHEWRLRKFISESNWPALLAGIEALPLSLQKEVRWQYWHARTSALLGKNPQTISETYRALAQQRSFYGFMASDWLEQTYEMEHRPPAISDEEIDKLSVIPAIARVKELRYHGFMLEARREWRDATRTMNEEQLVIAAHLATRWHWHHQSIFTMIKASYWDDIDTRFPVLHREHFQNYTQKHELPLHLIMALARQESAFRQRAVSPAGARGLMQLMPTTASYVAKQHKIPYKKREELFNPEKNIQLGTQYDRDMLNRFDDNRILATAAYNAGPHRVDGWLSNSKGTLPFDAWIEIIPFKETRNYVQNVLAFSAIYAHHLGKNDRILSSHERKQTL